MNKHLAHKFFARFHFISTHAVLPLALTCAAVIAVSAQTKTPVTSDGNHQPMPAVGTVASHAATAASPSDTVRAFYKALRERRFRDAFAMSIYKPAVEPLSDAEFEELRPDFERTAAAISDKFEITGEQITNETATVFVRGADGDDTGSPTPVTLFRDSSSSSSSGVWIIGDRADQEAVKKSGKDFFFNARVETHQDEVQKMLQRLPAAELIYGSQRGGIFGDLNALVDAGLMPKDLLGTESTGYRIHVAVGKDGKGYVAGAEPERYGRTGRLSFYIDNQTLLKSEDNKGKPLKSPQKK